MFFSFLFMSFLPCGLLLVGFVVSVLALAFESDANRADVQSGLLVQWYIL